MRRGLFIVFEGGEGSGKSTQARMLADALHHHDIPWLLTHEPGDTPLGQHIRGMLLHGNAGVLFNKAEALLFAADRAQHVDQVIQPALAEGKVVICDRYEASTMAYQVFGNGLIHDTVLAISEWASGELKPDITFLLDIDPMIGLERAKKDGEGDRYEAEELIYHNRVRQGFKDQKNDSWVELPGNLSPDELHEKILDHVLHILAVLHRWDCGVQTVEETKFYAGLSPAPIKVVHNCPDCGIVLMNMFGSDTEKICPNNHGWMTINGEGDTMWHPPATVPISRDKICTKKDCMKPDHPFGHAADELPWSSPRVEELRA